MLLLVSDVSTEVYYYRMTDDFRNTKENNPNLDEESWVQLYAAPLVLGYYAICYGFNVIKV